MFYSQRPHIDNAIGAITLGQVHSNESCCCKPAAVAQDATFTRYTETQRNKRQCKVAVVRETNSDLLFSTALPTHIRWLQHSQESDFDKHDSGSHQSTRKECIAGVT